MGRRFYGEDTALFSTRVVDVSTQCAVFGNVTPVSGVESDTTGRVSKARIVGGVPSSKMQAHPRDDREPSQAA